MLYRTFSAFRYHRDLSPPTQPQRCSALGPSLWMRTALTLGHCSSLAAISWKACLSNTVAAAGSRHSAGHLPGISTLRTQSLLLCCSTVRTDAVWPSIRHSTLLLAVSPKTYCSTTSARNEGQSAAYIKMLKGTGDAYDGVAIAHESLPTDPTTFANLLQSSLEVKKCQMLSKLGCPG